MSAYARAVADTLDRDAVLLAVAELVKGTGKPDATQEQPTTRRNYMLDAWQRKAQRSFELLFHMNMAPALFRPEFVAETYAEYAHAVDRANYWFQHGGA